jgi:hypothetical protein
LVCVWSSFLWNVVQNLDFSLQNCYVCCFYSVLLTILFKLKWKHQAKYLKEFNCLIDFLGIINETFFFGGYGTVGWCRRRHQGQKDQRMCRGRRVKDHREK